MKMIKSTINHSVFPSILVFVVTFIVATIVSSTSIVKAEAATLWEVERFTSKIGRLSPIDAGYDDADFYYPVASIDSNTDVDISQQRSNSDSLSRWETFPLLVFLQGGNVDKKYYSEFSTRLASYGYVVVVSNHVGYMASQWTPTDVLNDVIQRNSLRSSPLFGIVNTTVGGLSGHSNGGAAALFAASMTCQPPFCFGPPNSYIMPVEFRAAVVHGTHTVPVYGTQGDGASKADDTIAVELEPLDVNNTIPVAVINGEYDSLDHVCASWPLLEDEKDIIVLEGANHWALTDIQNPPGAVAEDVEQTIPQSLSIDLSAEWTALVFDAYLKHDETSIKILEQNKYDNGVYLNQHCMGDDDETDLDAGRSTTVIAWTLALMSVVIVIATVC